MVKKYKLGELEKAARNLVAMLDYTDPNWRADTVVEDGDEVNDAWVRLVRVLEGWRNENDESTYRRQSMKEEKKAMLEKAGYTVTDTKEFLGLTDEESLEVDRMAERYEITGDTVIEHATGLEWKCKSEGPMAWHEAQNYATTLGAGWRLPTREEFGHLIGWGRFSHAIDFQEIGNRWYWTSSKSSHYDNYACVMYLGDGDSDYERKDYKHYVRFVRSVTTEGTK
ncbi:MAG: DUF1566 domain-containing protein [Candidatus Uhrbacteria bacterium]|nr:DUF1566 domain-containing protein [Candidatus Uhrbacteria bacterium]